MGVKKARHILQLNVREQEEFLNSFDLVLSDCDGVVWSIANPIPGTGEAICLLKNAGKQVKFVSNNSLRTDEEYIAKFKAIGAGNVPKDDVMQPTKAMLVYLKKHLPGKKVFSICSPVANEMLRNNGIDVETLESTKELEIPDLVTTLKPKHEVAAVLLDLNLNLNYAQLVKANQYLLQKDCLLITGGLDTHMPVTDGFIIQGFFDFITHLTTYSNKQAIPLGKPSPHLAEILRQTYTIAAPKRCLFIGDTLQQDVQFGVKSGFQTLFVLSGVYTKEDMLATDDALKPDYYADSLRDITALFKNIKGN